MPQINLSDILYDERFNCRGPILDEEVERLAALIKESGLLNPITVRTAEDAGITSHKWHLVAGHRRYRAVVGLGWKTVEATIRHNCKDKEAHKLNLTENLERKNLTPGQELEAILAMFGDNPKPAVVAQELGVGKEWVRRRLKIQQTSPKIRPYFFDGSLNAFDLSVLIGCPLDEQEKLAEQLLEGKRRGMSSTVLMREKNKLSRPKTKSEIREMITKLTERDLEPPCWKGLAWAAGDLAEKDLLDKDQ